MTDAELDAILGHAVVSDCGLFRYVLTRTWDAALPACVFVGLNPSTADATRNDATIRKCMRFAMAWGYGGLVMLNCFAYRATDPNHMRNAADPIGPLNDFYLDTFIPNAALTVAAWGEYGFDRGRALRARFAGRLKALRLNYSGQPAHPLYLPADLVPFDY